ncbi:probable LRR receptor-like serine/threonine-protein kinase At3g47570 isoform X2 [Capsicum annuum]|uniref:probable LRR receptor-like serine/threonine-protein kinase At3g47570 isoform X2 n=1 Tax=Capsicum annuum TaxID=4072 RepID=UPI001FB088F9|nr:probable LRR receptor-like serine/threonine-protein kinase At3g47570 isoform X2 [Capsicum annuum]
MEKAFKFFFLTLLFLMASSAMTQTNITTDQLALLSLKSQIISDPSHFLDENWSPAISVCHWVGVTCGSRHQRVKTLNLSSMALTGRIPREFGNLSFLVSLNLGSNNFNGNFPQEMTRLRRLKFLDLSFNSFSGEVPSWLGFLHQLQFLNLGDNSFTGSIPSSFSNISKLETLNMEYNSIEGQIPKVIGSLINLRELNMRGNKLIGSVPQSLSNASRLETLEISHNSLQGNIPEGIGNLHNMKSLGVEFNQLTGSIPFQIFNNSRIELIAFTMNSLTGNLPNSLCNDLSILKEIYLSKNNLQGHMPTSLSNCSQLHLLGLSYNEFDGPIHSEIGRLSNLQYLYLGFNHFKGEIPKEISNLIELKVLDLGLNSFSGSLPMEIFNISGLRVISLSFNNLSGSLPPNMCSVIPNIEELYLDILTDLVGTIPHSISNCPKLTNLDLSGNKLTGLIPISLGYLTHLEYLNLGGNNLSSDSSLSFLTSLTNSRNLTFLDISFNPLNGMLPASMDNFSTSLRKFYANGCKIKGRIPNDFGNLSSLLDIDLSGNNLVGSIPTSIGNLRDLQRFNLSSNKFTGSIGDHICKMKHLGDIYLGQNQFSGSLPYCLGNITSLREIHLSSNKLSSNIPQSLGNLHDLVVLDLSSNNMVGSLPPEVGNLKVVTMIDLSMNQFSNRIPREIGGLQNLAHLSLRHNKLKGSIPDSMSNMVGLEFLDLSHNNISGSIPKSLEKLQNLKYFNISANKLYGEIPSGGPFKNLSSQFFIYNGALCGSSRFSVPPCSTSSKHRSNRKKILVLFLLLAIAVVFVPMAFVLLWIRYRRGKSVPQQADLLSTVARERISYYELLRATNALSESNLIGSGSFGSVYKGILRSGTAIAVKVFNLQLDAEFKSFDTECEVLCILRHRNLVKVITSCSNLDFKALVLEYMPNGSLEKYLYSYNYFLDIQQRLSIMIDVACALEYLHHGCSSVVIHCDLKPSNVLLDEDMVAHLSDFGISKLLGDDEIDLYTETLATLGYIAPEYGLDGLVSTKCDIYSYGIMLLETFTRRKPNEFEGDLSLKQWMELDVVASIMKVALDCCAESPARRTNMKDVVAMLQKIKIKLLAS